MRGKTERIDNIIQHIFLKKGYADNLKLNPIKDLIKDFFKGEPTDTVKVVSIKRNVLTLSVGSSSLLYEVKYFKSDDLLKRVNEISDVKIQTLNLVMDDIKHG